MADTVDITPRLSVIIPAFNEAATIAEVIRRVQAVDADKEIIVVDDSSVDDTATIVGAIPGVKLIRQDRNEGKGAAIRRAIPEVRGNIIAIQDADLEYYPEDLPSLLEPFDDPSVDAVYGSRFRAGTPRMRLANLVANKILAWTATLLFMRRITDEATCYKLFRRGLLQGMTLTCRRFEFCPEVTAKALRQGRRIVEVPIRYNPRTVSEGKKITWQDGVYAFWTLVKYRFLR